MMKVPLTLQILFLLGFGFGGKVFAENGVQIDINTTSLCEPSAEPSPKIKAFTKSSHMRGGAKEAPSKLDGLTSDDLKKTADLTQPVIVEILSVGREVKGLEDIKDRIIDVRVTNPNPYPIFFRGRQSGDNKTITPLWNKLENGVWILAGRDLCGTGVRDWDIEPNGSVDLMLSLAPQLKEQQILGKFYRADNPSIQSDCLLYEKK